jgi:hypothetical protein
MALFACLSRFLTQNLAPLGMGMEKVTALKVLLNLSWVWCVFLLPFLQKDKWGGWALLIVGAPMALFLNGWVLGSANGAGGGPARAAEGIGAWFNMEAQLFAMLGIGGLYCLIPGRKKREGGPACAAHKRGIFMQFNGENLDKPGGGAYHTSLTVFPRRQALELYAISQEEWQEETV